MLNSLQNTYRKRLIGSAFFLLLNTSCQLFIIKKTSNSIKLINIVSLTN